MKRRRQTLKAKDISKKGLLQNVGGHLLNPPEECCYRKSFPDKSIWADLGCCSNVCKNKCSLFKWFLKASEPERVQYLIDNNVYYPWGCTADTEPREEQKEPEEKELKEWEEKPKTKYQRRNT